MPPDGTLDLLWPYIYIAIAGWLATDMWRWLGVLLGSRISEDSVALIWVRSVATALVAAVVARLILYPAGSLEATPVMLRVVAVIVGFLAFLGARKNIFAGIVSAEVILVAGIIYLQ
ncbi:AzlD domain-containing protein [Hoeflea poritis]|uniref:AzlD domain-containing protein n=1 Tax=Hoeflea poritis TaxID=2993659 RepID=A0ABT4VUV1_9HYPH|nr:AzlD domain-containing protein [Hoeflea poritis]MDA4847763.1 AzlD domain-containing protein [Hoeflea poritis]